MLYAWLRSSVVQRLCIDRTVIPSEAGNPYLWLWVVGRDASTALSKTTTRLPICDHTFSCTAIVRQLRNLETLKDSESA
jgi:hypothetical protein